ncbi:hypothetical protein [Sphingomonas hengshuiensis]|uniref:hypothetical protein n=1 Tax=Sphingomonas hengshuiensis TaxID=1609977 RepID=UPI000A91E242|nr:hypothetical protein [Sphingomonas hengshuiensis]
MADENTPGTTDSGVPFNTDPNHESRTDPLGGASGIAIEPEAAPAGADAKPSTTERLREEAGKLGSQAADRARSYADQGKERATSALDEVAKMMASAAEDVDAKLGVEYGRYARSAADGISGFAETLRGQDVDDLIAGATDFVRKSPVIAVGAAAAVGFMIARLVKSGVDAASDKSPSSTATDPIDV